MYKIYLLNGKENQEGFPKPYLEEREGDQGLLGDLTWFGSLSVLCLVNFVVERRMYQAKTVSVFVCVT